jgi:hypothetical protein
MAADVFSHLFPLVLGTSAKQMALGLNSSMLVQV